MIQSSAVETTKLYLANIIQRRMTLEVASNELLEHLGLEGQDLIGALKQHVHQQGYLKNIIDMDGGLDHVETFDEHAGCISNELRKRSRKIILAVFFRQISLKIVHAVQENFNNLPPASREKFRDALQKFLDQYPVDPEMAWNIQESPPLLHFLDGKILEITAETAKRCITLQNLESDLWELNSGLLRLTEKGRTEFAILNPDVLLDDQGEITDENALSFLGFVEEYRKELIKRQVYDPERKELTAHGTAVFLEKIQDPNSHLSKVFNRLNLAEELVVTNIKDYSILLNSFLQECVRNVPMQWSFKSQPLSYELTQFGALSLLQKAGYINVEDSYIHYQNLKNELRKQTQTLKELPPDSQEARKLVAEVKEISLELQLVRETFREELLPPIAISEEELDEDNLRVNLDTL